MRSWCGKVTAGLSSRTTHFRQSLRSLCDHLAKSDRDDAAEAAWRWAVEFADSNGCSGGRGSLKRFNANRERCSCDAMRREQQAAPSTSS
jgi:hypothetical protein